MRFLPPLALSVLIVVAACTASPQAAPAEPPAAEPLPADTTTTAPAPAVTTTTVAATPAIVVTGVPEELAALVESLYEHAAGTGATVIDAAYLPERGVAEGMAGRTGRGATATLLGMGIALVEAGPDLVAAVDDGGGWRIVAVDLPSLEHRELGYTSAVVAVVGSDARKGEDAVTARADSLHLVGFDGVAGTIDFVGIPRDSWVEIPGSSSGKINSALATGGPERMQATLERLAGYPLDGYVITGFEGFQEALGNVLGGIQITLDAPMRDASSGANFTAGEQYMNGPQALAFARTRKTLPKGDIDRQRNGGIVLIAAAFTAGFREVPVVPDLLERAFDWMVTDLDATMVMRLALTSRIAPVLEMKNVVLPGVPGQRGNASTIELTAAAREILADLADGSLDR